MLVAGARSVPAASSCADETEDRVVLGQRRNRRGRSSTTRSFARGICGHESASAAADAGKFAAPNETPDGRPRDAERASGLLDADQVSSHVGNRITDCLTVSSSHAAPIAGIPGRLPAGGEVAETDLDPSMEVAMGGQETGSRSLLPRRRGRCDRDRPRAARTDGLEPFNRRDFGAAGDRFGIDVLAPADAVRRLENQS